MAGERDKRKFQKCLCQSRLPNESFAIMYRCQKLGEDCFLHGAPTSLLAWTLSHVGYAGRLSFLPSLSAP